ncbi:nuclear factor 7, brain-like [Pelodytes ibericus]
MATAKPTEATLSEELTCAVCCEMLTDPVMLECMHHFCRACITHYLDSTQKEPCCPHCRALIANKAVKSNYLLKKVVELVKRCGTPEYQSKIENDLKALQKSREKQLSGLIKKKEEAEKKIGNVKETGHDMRRQIVAEFQTLHEILLTEEKKLLTSVDEEEKKSLDRLVEIVTKLEEQISGLTEDVAYIQETLQKSGDFFMVEAEEVKRRPAVRVDSPVLDNCDLFYNKHKGPLQYMVWRRMFKSILPVPEPITYDSSTAHPSLMFSNDLRSVTDGERPPRLPIGDASRRFLQCVNVLGSRVYRGGRHYWEVWVGNKTKWDVGVASDSVNRKARVKLNPKNGYWALRMIDVHQYIAATVPWTTLQIDTPLQRIGVYLDCGSEEVTFLDAEHMGHLFTFTGVNAEGFYPFFSPGLHNGDQNSDPMRICHLIL